MTDIIVITVETDTTIWFALLKILVFINKYSPFKMNRDSKVIQHLLTKPLIKVKVK